MASISSGARKRRASSPRTIPATSSTLPPAAGFRRAIAQVCPLEHGYSSGLLRSHAGGCAQKEPAPACAGGGLSLPFRDEMFDALTVAFVCATSRLGKDATRDGTVCCALGGLLLLSTFRCQSLLLCAILPLYLRKCASLRDYDHRKQEAHGISRSVGSNLSSRPGVQELVERGGFPTAARNLSAGRAASTRLEGKPTNETSSPFRVPAQRRNSKDMSGASVRIGAKRKFRSPSKESALPRRGGHSTLKGFRSGQFRNRPRGTKTKAVWGWRRSTVTAQKMRLSCATINLTVKEILSISAW